MRVSSRQRRALLGLLERRPLPLRALVKTVASDPALTALVLASAAEEGATRPLHVESAIVLLGAEGLRSALARKTARSTLRARNLRTLREAIAGNRYRVNPRAIAAAMLDELDRPQE